jgi:GNAT superfamily N-acetyltransferase
VLIRRARPGDGDELRRIAVAAKRHWGYDPEMFHDWPAPGDVDPAALAAYESYVAEADGRPVAWSLVLPRDDVMWLSDLWVDPDWMGRGVGSRLFAHAAEAARELGASALEWEADPHAVGFYEKMGGRHVRQSEPSEWGRVLPVMRLDLRP